MVTTKNADNALKAFYLEAVAKAIDTRTNPLLAKIEHTSVGVSGKEVRKFVRYGINGGVGSGSETGDLPKAHASNYVQYVLPLKNIYGTIEISDKALRASSSDEGALVNLLNAEMEGLVEATKYHFGRMIYGDGSGMVAIIEKVDGNCLVVEDCTQLIEGMVVIPQNVSIAGFTAPSMVITKVDRSFRKVYFDKQYDFSQLSQGCSLMTTINNDELTGLGALFEGDTLYDVDKDDYPFMRGYSREYDEDDFQENFLVEAIDALEESCGSKVNMIVCSWGIRRSIEYYFRDMGTPLPTIDLGNGFKALEYRGIPIIADRFCQKGTIYLLNTDDFKLCQLCDWQWMESEDGAILRQIPGKPVYSATLVKYADLICERPYGQGRLTGIVES